MRTIAHACRAAIALISLAVWTPAHAEGGNLFGGTDPAILTLRWEPAYPLPDLKGKLTDQQVAYGGVSGDVRFALGSSPISLGLATSWNRFPGANNGFVTAVSTRLVGHVYLTRSGFQPYLGVGVGGAWTDVSVNGAPSSSSYAFAADPELGFLVTLVPELALDVLLRYEFTTASANGAKNLQWLALGIGFGFY
jgi:hypothetical protein